MYIHQTENWPNFTWDQTRIGLKLAKVNKAAGFLEGRLSAIGFDVQQQATVEALTHDIVASSEIEGVVLNSDQVRFSVARRMGVHITNETEPYRVDDLDVISGTLERERVHYHAPAAELVPSEMEKFLDWFNADSTPKDYIKSAVAHFWFVSIHPFDDGNGRISRAIADMALSQADNSSLRYFSISRQINKEKRKYNDILERCQKGSVDITAWIDWYLDCMIRAIESAEEMLSSILNKAIFWQSHSQDVISDRQKQVLNTYLDGYAGKLKVKNWAKLASVSVDTAERDVKALVSSGILVPQPGRFRDVAYGIQVSKDILFVPGPVGEDD